MSKRNAEFQINKDNPNEPRTMNNEDSTRATAAQLAKRRIKSMPKRRGASPAASPGPSSSNPFNSNTTPSFGFGSPEQPQPQSNMFSFGAQPTQQASQSFPPTNGVPANDAITSKSFGGFGGSTFGNGTANDSGSNTGGTMFGSFTAPSSNSFNFASSTTTNPFSTLAAGPAAPVASPSTFNFGAPAAAATTQSTPFAFGAPAAAIPAQPSASPFSTSQSAFSFGATTSKPAEALKSPLTEPAKSPFTFGQSTGTSQTPAFGSAQPNSSTPSPSAAAESSPTTNSLFTSKFAANSNSTSSMSGNQATNPSTGVAASPFRFGSATPEPVAQTGSKETTPTPETTKAQSPAPPASNLFNFGATATPTANTSKPSDGLSKSLFAPSTSVTPSNISASNSGFNFGSPASTKEPSTAESASKPLFSFGSPAKASTLAANNTASAPLFPSAPTTSSAPSTQTPNLFAQSSQTKSSLSSSKYASSTPANPTAPKASATFKSVPPKSLTHTNSEPHTMPSLSPYQIMSETNMTPPAGIEATELAHFWRDVKLHRLNSQISTIVGNVDVNDPEHAFQDFRPVFESYIQTFTAIEQELAQKTSQHSAPAPNPSNSTFQATNSGSNIFGAAAAKRKAEDSPSALKEESSKKSRSDVGPKTPSKWASKQSSDTAKKIDGFLNNSPPKPTTNGTTTPEASPVKANLFNAGSTPFKPTTNTAASAGSTPFKVTSNSQLNASAGTLGAAANKATTTAEKPQTSTLPSSTDAPKEAGGFGPTGGFKPVGVAAGTDMFAAFKSKMEAAEKKRRKDETFDSDEDDEEEWEKNYEEEVRAKKAKLQQEAANHAPPPKFTITKPSSAFSMERKEDTGSEISRSVSPASSVLDGPRPTGSHLFANLSDAGSDAKDDDDEDDDEDTSKSANKNGSNGASLFDRVAPRDSTSGTPEENPGDHTWKPSTPIKFSSGSTFNYPAPAASAPPKTSNSEARPFNLFGAANPKATLTPAPTSSTTGFSFGRPSSALAPPSVASSALTSLDTSRASTPLESEAGSTAGEATQDEDDGSTPAEPASDLVNFDAATEGHQVLFKSDKAKSLKFIPDEDKRPSGTKNQPWVVQGIGPIAVLKNDETGVVSIFMKAGVGGRVVINTRVLSAVEYTLVGKRAKFLVPSPGSQAPVSWLVQFKADEIAKEFVNVCNQNK